MCDPSCGTGVSWMINLQPKFNFIFVNQNFILTLFTIMYIYKKVSGPFLWTLVYQWGYFYIKKTTRGTIILDLITIFFKQAPSLKKDVAYDWYKKVKDMHYSVWTLCHESLPDLQCTVLQLCSKVCCYFRYGLSHQRKFHVNGSNKSQFQF